MVESDRVERVYEKIAQWWAQDRQVRAPDHDPDWIPVPYPFIAAGGSESLFQHLYYWDSYFIVRGLLAQGFIRWAWEQIANLLDLVARFGFVPNGNRRVFLTRSQPPLLSKMVWAYYTSTRDRRFLKESYPLCAREMTYWLAPEHCPDGQLARWFDHGDPTLRPEMAAEAESGWDFTARFDGDARAWWAVDLNALLVGMLQDLANMAHELGDERQARAWLKQAQQWGNQVRQTLWDAPQNRFADCHRLTHRASAVHSLASFYPLWAELASRPQARAMLMSLDTFERRWGLVATDRVYPSPHPELQCLQWSAPVVWAPLQLIVIEGLEKYGYVQPAKRYAQTYLQLVARVFEKSGALFEKYNGETGDVDVPQERYPNRPFHGWTAGVFAVLAARHAAIRV
jgi:alpha,alpha-trehalase